MQLEIKDTGGVTFLLITIVEQEDNEDWIQAVCEFNYHGFNARFGFSAMNYDFDAFYKQLKLLYDTLKGEAVFSNIEGDISLKFSSDGLGHILVEGQLRHRRTLHLETSFLIETDQTFLPTLLDQCRAIVKQP